MFWILGIANSFEELFVSGRAADVLWRAAARDVREASVEFAAGGIADFAGFDLVVPAVAKVVEVVDRADFHVLNQLGQGGFVDGQIIAAEVRVGQTPGRTA